MIKRFGLEHFKNMPWKNGLGNTTELFRLPSSHSPEEFYFRLSMAQVQTDGPFSHFPHIDRTLMLLEGKGASLVFDQKELLLNKKLFPLLFKGEETIFARLLDGPILDFNVMVDRRWGKSRTNVEMLEGRISAKEDFLLIFDPVSKDLLVLEKNDECEMDSKHDLITVRVQKF